MYFIERKKKILLPVDIDFFGVEKNWGGFFNFFGVFDRANKFYPESALNMSKDLLQSCGFTSKETFGSEFLFSQDKNISLAGFSKDSCENRFTENIPDIYDSLARVVAGLGAKLIGVKIYLYLQKVFYSYLIIKNSKEKFDINVGFLDGVYLANKLNRPIFIKEELLLKLGTRVTAEMIEKALLME